MMINDRRIAVGNRPSRIAFALLLTVGLFGCAKPKTAPPTFIVVKVTGAADVNPDRSGRASPVEIRLYELKSTSVFADADFFSLYQKDKDVLGADLQGREVVHLAPGESKSVLDKEVKPDTAYLGIIAAFRDYEHARWRAAAQLVPGKANTVSIQIDRLAVGAKVSAAPAKRKK